MALKFVEFLEQIETSTFLIKLTPFEKAGFTSKIYFVGIYK